MEASATVASARRGGTAPQPSMIIDAESLPEATLRDLWRSLRATMPSIRPAWVMLGCSLVAMLWMTAFLVETLIRDGWSVMLLVIGIWGPFFLTSTIVGLLILSRWPEHRLGWILCIAGTAWLVAQGLYMVGMRGLMTGETEPWSMIAQAGGFYPFGLYLLCVEVPLIFPTGRLSSPVWHIARWIGLAGALGASLETMLGSSLVMHGEFGPIPNPWFVSDPPWLSKTLALIGYGFFVMLWMAIPALISMSRRLFYATGVERVQLQWIAWDASLVMAAYILHYTSATNGWYEMRYGWIVNIIWGLALQSIPIVTGIAILRYHLFDIHLVISRTLVYAILAVAIASIYTALITILGSRFQASDRQVLVVAIIIATIALLVQPARDRLQGAINRMLYGERDRPEALLMRLGAQLEASATPNLALREMTGLVAEMLRLPHVSVVTGAGDHARVIAISGEPGPVQVGFPMIFQGEEIGQLRASPRTPVDGFSREDRRVLTHLAGQAAVAAAADRMARELRGARESLVTAREEERRRLRRDLHDGLGAQLAALVLQAGVARKLAGTDRDAAVALLGDVQDELRSAITDIRHLVHGLRPPALDEFGLILALRSRIAAFQGAGNNALICEFHAPDELPGMHAAMEVAIFRIVEEAMTNVVRHAGARRAVVTIAVVDDVQVTIEDDGAGIGSGYTAGVGLHSMRERAEELGGKLRIVPGDPCGTTVAATFPFEPDGEAR
ncbi:MAG TPA: histidine kinase [Thermomicrobiales bacterium]|nr:histidine kinase [Thermomicrobiales bacterium]